MGADAFVYALTAAILLTPRATGAQAASQAVGPTPQEQRDSYTIYLMLLDRDPERPESPVRGIWNNTLLHEPVNERSCWPESTPSQRATYQPLIDDFKRRNQQPVRLEPKFYLSDYRLLTSEEADEVVAAYPTLAPPLPPPGAPPFPKTSPSANLKGITRAYFLSAVGFSADHRRALVYIATQFHGRYYFVVKRHGKWIIDKSYRGDVCEWWV